MTLPFGATLQKMWLPPYYLLFRVTIDNQPFLGRVDVLRYEQNHNKPSVGFFMSYKTIEDFKSGIVDKEIKTSADKVEILEIIDSHSNQHPSQINSLFDVYQTLITIPNNTDIGTLRRIIPETLDELNNAVEQFCLLHKSANKFEIVESIKESRNEFKRIKDDSTLLERINMVQDLKENLFCLVDKLIRYS